MEYQRALCLFLVLFSLVSISQAYKFYVGGRAGWVPNPSENYNQWAGRNRFQINDTLVFKYKKGSDSVLEVKKEDYDKCNKSKPIKKFEEGDTEFKLDRSGPFYFISGKDGNCENGQKLALVVLSPRGGRGGGQTPPPSVPAPTSPPSHSPSPSANAPSPSSLSPSPGTMPPAGSPGPASGPSGRSPATSPSPVSTPPAGSPGPASGPSGPSPATSPSPVSTPPAGSPGPASGPSGPSPAASPSPVSTTPAGSPGPAGGPPAPSPAGSPGPVGGPPSPSGETPPASSPSSSTPPPGAAHTPSSSNESVPPPRAGGSSVTPSSFLVYAVTIVVGAALLN